MSEPIQRNKFNGVLMMTPSYFPFLGGLERQCHTLSVALASTGMRVNVATGKHEQSLVGEENIKGVFVKRMFFSKSRVLRGLLFMPSLMYWAWKKRREYDVLHVHCFGWYMIGILPLVRLLKKPVLMKIPSVRELGIPGIRTRLLGNILLKLTLASDQFVSLCDECSNELKAEGIAANRIFEVNNGVDTEQFRPSKSDEEKQQIREKLNLPAGKLLLFSGRLNEQKGLLYLFAALPTIFKEHPDAKLVLCGEGPLEEKLRGLCQQNSIEDTVIFLGHVNDMTEFYRAADIFILPSFGEGNSNALLEAMASGLAIVASNVGGTPLLLGDVKGGLVEPKNEDAIQTKLLNILSDPELQRQMGSAALNRVRSEFSINRIAEKYSGRYLQLLRK